MRLIDYRDFLVSSDKYIKYLGWRYIKFNGAPILQLYKNSASIVEMTLYPKISPECLKLRKSSIQKDLAE